MKLASEASGFEYVEVYINAVPFSVLKCKPAAKKAKAKKAARNKK